MSMIIKVNGVILPSPVSVELSDETLWSAGTGRSVKTGEMLGAVVASKSTLDIEWQWISHSEYLKIKNALKKGFFGPVKYESSDGSETANLALAYRSNILRVDGNTVNGIRYYRSVKTSIIEK